MEQQTDPSTRVAELTALLRRWYDGGQCRRVRRGQLAPLDCPCVYCETRRLLYRIALGE